MTDIITGPGNYCRADGVKVRITHRDDPGWRGDDGAYRTWGGFGTKNEDDIISTWSDRPDEFRKPKPAYRKDGSPRWPVGTRAVLTAWEDKTATMQPPRTMTVADDGLPTWDLNGSAIIGTKGFRPLFRKIKDAAPKPEPRELVLWGCFTKNMAWLSWAGEGDTHRLSLTIIGDQVTGTLEAL